MHTQRRSGVRTIMAEAPLNVERQRLFNELIWRLMGNLQSSAWRDLLDPRSRLGAAARAYYRELLTAPDDDDPLALPSGASFVIAQREGRR